MQICKIGKFIIIRHGVLFFKTYTVFSEEGNKLDSGFNKMILHNPNSISLFKGKREFKVDPNFIIRIDTLKDIMKSLNK